VYICTQYFLICLLHFQIMCAMRRPHHISPQNGRVFTDGRCDPSLSSTVSKVCQQTTSRISCLRCRSPQKVDMLQHAMWFRDAQAWNVGRDVECPVWGFSLSHPPPPKCMKILQIRPRPLLSTSFPIHCSALSSRWCCAVRVTKSVSYK
jgi:hypothetical protein